MFLIPWCNFITFFVLFRCIAFMAPEVITNSQEGCGRAADIWGMACVVIEMATGKVGLSF